MCIDYEKKKKRKKKKKTPEDYFTKLKSVIFILMEAKIYMFLNLFFKKSKIYKIGWFSFI